MNNLLKTGATIYDGFVTPAVEYYSKEDIKEKFVDFEEKKLSDKLKEHPMVLLRPDFPIETPDLSRLDNVRIKPKIQEVKLNDNGVGSVMQWDDTNTTIGNFLKRNKDTSNLLGGHSDEEFFSQKQFTVKYCNDIDYESLKLNFEDTFDINSKENLGLEKFGKILGVNTCLAYIGTEGSCSDFHQEDCNFGSTNRHVVGAPKVWFAIKYEDSKKLFEKLAKILPEKYRECPEYDRHKSIILDMGKVSSHFGITVYKLIQRPGDIVVTAAGAPHQIYNCGLNFTYASNHVPKSPFALKVIQEARSCSCKLGQNKLSRLPIPPMDKKLYFCLSKPCPQKYATPFSVVRHLKHCSYGIKDITVGDVPPVKCPFCSEMFSRVDVHMQQQHKDGMSDSFCGLCGSSTSDLGEHHKKCRTCKFCGEQIYNLKLAISHSCQF